MDWDDCSNVEVAKENCRCRLDLLLVAVIVDFIKRWLGENYFSDPNITIVFNLAATVFLTGIVVGISYALISAKKFDLWVPDERVYELPDASFLCEYFGFIGGHYRVLRDAARVP